MSALPSNSHNCASIYSASVCEMHKIYYTINGDKSTFLRSLDDWLSNALELSSIRLFVAIPFAFIVPT